MESKLGSTSTLQGLTDHPLLGQGRRNRLVPHGRRPLTGWDPARARERYRKVLDKLLGGDRRNLNYERLHPVIDRLLQRLDNREAQVLRLRYGIEDGYPKSWQEVGSHLQISPHAAKEASERALSKLLFVLTCRGQPANRN